MGAQIEWHARRVCSVRHASAVSCIPVENGWSSGPGRQEVEYPGSLGWRTSDGQCLKAPIPLAVVAQATPEETLSSTSFSNLGRYGCRKHPHCGCRLQERVSSPPFASERHLSGMLEVSYGPSGPSLFHSDASSTA